MTTLLTTPPMAGWDRRLQFGPPSDVAVGSGADPLEAASAVTAHRPPRIDHRQVHVAGIAPSELLQPDFDSASQQASWSTEPQQAFGASRRARTILASLSLRAPFGTAHGLGVTQPNSVGRFSALVLEAGLTAVLMIVILAVATDTRAAGSLAAIAIGGTIGLEARVLRPVTGASMNRARSLPTALAAGDRTNRWIYIVGPITGALVGVAIYEALRGPGGRVVGPADAQLPVVVEQAPEGQ
jgi:hypothetical protein